MSRTRAIPLLTLMFALTIVGLAGAQPQSGIVRPTTEPSKPTVQLGSELYAGNCASCHGIDGSGINKPRPGAGGLPGAGPSLRGVGAETADLYLREGFMPLANIHAQPEREPVLFSETEIRSLVSYVASLGPGAAIPAPSPSSGSIAEGVHLFTDHCSGCHQEDAEGGYVTGARVPPLQDISPTQIAEAVRVGPYLMPRFSKRQITDPQLNSIIRYILTTPGENRGGWRIGNIGPIPEGLVSWWIAVPLVIVACMLAGRRFRRE
jgi:quinol---cytochrome-c reductase cytochrome c subunit